MGLFIDLAEQTFGRLTVKEPSGKDKWGSYYWLCICSCGKTCRTTSGNLRSGNAESCGCLNRERMATQNKSHGLCHKQTYQVWLRMKARCYGELHPKRHRYQDRGITVCDEWKNDFAKFYQYMGDRPSKIHSIDRINNDGNYEPGNCRWATPKQQANNRSNSKPEQIELLK